MRSVKNVAATRCGHAQPSGRFQGGPTETRPDVLAPGWNVGAIRIGWTGAWATDARGEGDDGPFGEGGKKLSVCTVSTGRNLRRRRRDKETERKKQRGDRVF